MPPQVSDPSAEELTVRLPSPADLSVANHPSGAAVYESAAQPQAPTADPIVEEFTVPLPQPDNSVSVEPPVVRSTNPLPPPPRSRRKRRRRRRVIVSLAVLIIILAAAAIAGDLFGRKYTERTASAQLAGFVPFQSPPSVRVIGEPFLNQAIRGRYDNVAITANDAKIGDIGPAPVDVHLYRARLPLSKLFKGKVNELPVERITATLICPYQQLSALSGRPDMTIAADGDQLKISGPAEVSLGFTTFKVNFVAHGKVSVINQGKSIHVTITDLQTDGNGFTSILAKRYADDIAKQVPDVAIPTLPYGLQVTDAAVRPEGLAINSSANNVVLRKQQQ